MSGASNAFLHDAARIDAQQDSVSMKRPPMREGHRLRRAAQACAACMAFMQMSTYAGEQPDQASMPASASASASASALAPTPALSGAA